MFHDNKHTAFHQITQCYLDTKGLKYTRRLAVLRYDEAKGKLLFTLVKDQIGCPSGFFFHLQCKVFKLSKTLSWNCEGSGSKERSVINVTWKENALKDAEGQLAKKSHTESEVLPELAPLHPGHDWNKPNEAGQEAQLPCAGVASTGRPLSPWRAPVGLALVFLPPPGREKRIRMAQGPCAGSSKASSKPPRAQERSQMVTKQFKKKKNGPRLHHSLINYFAYCSVE